MNYWRKGNIMMKNKDILNENAYEYVNRLFFNLLKMKILL